MLLLHSLGAMQNDEGANYDLIGDSLDEKITPRAQSLDPGPGTISGTTEEKVEKMHPSIRENDVLCGRGKISFNHSGNREFR